MARSHVVMLIPNVYSFPNIINFNITQLINNMLNNIIKLIIYSVNIFTQNLNPVVSCLLYLYRPTRAQQESNALSMFFQSLLPTYNPQVCTILFKCFSNL